MILGSLCKHAAGTVVLSSAENAIPLHIAHKSAAVRKHHSLSTADVISEHEA